MARWIRYGGVSWWSVIGGGMTLWPEVTMASLGLAGGRSVGHSCPRAGRMMSSGGGVGLGELASLVVGRFRGRRPTVRHAHDPSDQSQGLVGLGAHLAVEGRVGGELVAVGGENLAEL